VLADGTNLRRVTFGEGNNIFPAWSPDGERIVFGAQRGGKRGIYVINADGTGEQKIHEGGYLARFSPDGRSLAILDGNWPSSRLSIGKADGSEMRPLPPL
jgi:TolB protein